MPKEQFFKLKDQKREKIILAARDEFSCKPYDEVSIHDIVARSNISRGSFYIYFDDKWDIYSHLLKCAFNKIIDRLNDTINRGNNIFFAIIDIYDYLIIESNLDESIGFISNILKNINPVTYERINDYLGNSIANDVLENISFKKDDYLISAPIEFSVLRKLLVNCLFKSLVEVLVYKRDPHQTREELRIAFNILKYGSYK